MLVGCGVCGTGMISSIFGQNVINRNIIKKYEEAEREYNTITPNLLYEIIEASSDPIKEKKLMNSNSTQIKYYHDFNKAIIELENYIVRIKKALLSEKNKDKITPEMQGMITSNQKINIPEDTTSSFYSNLFSKNIESLLTQYNEAFDRLTNAYKIKDAKENDKKKNDEKEDNLLTSMLELALQMVSTTKNPKKNA